ncbi:MAG TPA: hypothetical protein VIN75_16650 [Burkholderiaceae bacterium]
MTRSRPDDDAAFDDFLRGSAPKPLADHGFTARTMAAVERATRAQPVRRRAAPPAPLAIARALAIEQQLHDAQARRWRWATAGVVAGYLLLVLAVWLSPEGSVAAMLPTPGEVFPVGLLLAAGAAWVAVRELRAA